LIGSVEKTHSKLYTSDRKLHELIAAATTENWTVMRKHNQRMAGILEQIIASGMAANEPADSPTSRSRRRPRPAHIPK
jgi:hypothetical protein